MLAFLQHIYVINAAYLQNFLGINILALLMTMFISFGMLLQCLATAYTHRTSRTQKTEKKKLKYIKNVLYKHTSVCNTGTHRSPKANIRGFNENGKKQTTMEWNYHEVSRIAVGLNYMKSMILLHYVIDPSCLKCVSLRLLSIDCGAHIDSLSVSLCVTVCSRFNYLSFLTCVFPLRIFPNHC